MLKFVLLLAVVAGALGGVIPPGLETDLDERIVGGRPASISTFPYQVSLQLNGQHICGGSILSQQVIVTAAHCLERLQPQNLRIRAGSSQWNSGGVLVGVRSFRMHERYNSNTFANDIAVIRLSSLLTFSSTIRSIHLATSTPQTNTIGRVSGWGTTFSGASQGTRDLMFVDLRIISRADCGSNRFNHGPNRITESMICTYEAGRDACQGDSGGPLITGNGLVGVVSWGIGCARERFPGVYANVPFLRNWILGAKAALEKQP